MHFDKKGLYSFVNLNEDFSKTAHFKHYRDSNYKTN